MRVNSMYSDDMIEIMIDTRRARCTYNLPRDGAKRGETRIDFYEYIFFIKIQYYYKPDAYETE